MTPKRSPHGHRIGTLPLLYRPPSPVGRARGGGLWERRATRGVHRQKGGDVPHPAFKSTLQKVKASVLQFFLFIIIAYVADESQFNSAPAGQDIAHLD